MTAATSTASGWCTVSEAGRLLRMGPGDVAKLVEVHRLPYRKVRWQMLVDVAALARFLGATLRPE